MIQETTTKKDYCPQITNSLLSFHWDGFGRTLQEYPTEPLLRLSAPRAEIPLAGNLNREFKSWLGIYPERFSYCDFCLNVVPGWKQQLSLPL